MDDVKEAQERSAEGVGILSKTFMNVNMDRSGDGTGLGVAGR